MRIALSTAGFTDWTLPRVIDAAARAGFSGLVLRTDGQDSRWFTPDPSLTSAAKVRRLCAAAGLEPVALATTISYDQPVTPPVVGRLRPDFDRSVKLTKAAVELADNIGAAFVRVCARNPDAPSSADLKPLRQRLDMALTTTRNTGVRLLLENTGMRAHAAGLLAFANEMPGLDFDLAYNTLTGYQAGDDLTRAVPQLAGRCAAITLADSVDNTPCPLGQGRLPIERITRSLASANYPGWIIYEPTDIPADYADAYTLLTQATTRLRQWWDRGVNWNTSKLEQPTVVCP